MLNCLKKIKKHILLDLVFINNFSRIVIKKGCFFIAPFLYILMFYCVARRLHRSPSAWPQREDKCADTW
jgi:hypothetical protein